MINSRLKIKICGLSRPQDCQAVNAAGADFAGFVFAPSRRQVNIKQAAALIDLLSPHILAAGVFVDETADEIIETVKHARLSVVQLHGSADPEKILTLRLRLPPSMLIWQRLAIPLGSPAQAEIPRLSDDMVRFSALQALPDAWLLDSCRGSQAGGTGENFDWAGYAGLELNAPLVLAGGLTPENIRQAIRLMQPDVVDTSSGVETAGFKDPDKIISFCENARRCIP